MGIRAALLCLTMAFLAPAAQACEIPSAKASVAREVITYTNALRAQKGRPPLKVSGTLTDAAQKHACYMAAKRKMSHRGVRGSNVADRVNAEGYRWRTVGENVAFAYPTPRSVVDGWSGSRGHRRNLLTPKVTEIGIGLAQDGGRNYWVMVLARPR